MAKKEKQPDADAKKEPKEKGEAKEKPKEKGEGKPEGGDDKKKGKGKKGEGKPEAAPDGEAAASAPAPPPVKTAPKPAAEGESKKKKRAGVAPPRGKKLRNIDKTFRAKIEKEGPTNIKRAVALLKGGKRAKFDETVEVHMNLGIDSTQSDQMVRGTVSLPHGIGKSVRVIVFCQGENAGKATEAGADHAGSDELIKKVQGGWTDFDVALATQDMMGQVSRLGKILGPRGLMPTPKAGTVITGDISNAVKEFKAGKVEYRSDKSGNIHAGVGKLSFDEDKLAENITTFVDQVKAVKPSSVKGNYILSVTVSATMSPGIRVTV